MNLHRFASHAAILPTPVRALSAAIVDDAASIVAEPVRGVSEPISAFVCVIDYDGEVRLITCRSFSLIDDLGYVGAICHVARGYRQFRCDRITAVSDAVTGEVLGDGEYFHRFDPSSVRLRAPSWNLTRSQKATLVAGLNVLAFMARCDGRWHPLETDPVEQFVRAMWRQKAWAGDPAIDEILDHAQRLAPDADIFFTGLAAYHRSRNSTRILKRAVSDLVAADGIICQDEFDWCVAFDDHMRELGDAEARGVAAKMAHSESVDAF